MYYFDHGSEHTFTSALPPPFPRLLSQRDLSPFRDPSRVRVDSATPTGAAAAGEGLQQGGPNPGPASPTNGHSGGGEEKNATEGEKYFSAPKFSPSSQGGSRARPGSGSRRGARGDGSSVAGGGGVGGKFKGARAGNDGSESEEDGMERR